MGEPKAAGWPGKEELIRYFEGLLTQHGPDSSLSLDWKDDRIQKLRFALLLFAITVCDKKKGISLLDVGCGLGDMYGFLEERGLIKDLAIDYLGVDIAPKMIEAARKKYPAAKFEAADILSQGFDRKADYVAASGIFNIKICAKEENNKFILAMLRKMYELAGQAAAVNFQSRLGISYLNRKGCDLNKSRYVFYEPTAVLELARSLADRLILRHDYYPLDFTVYLLKERKFVPAGKKD